MARTRRTRKTNNPRILIVTPEITYLPEGMGNMANRLSAKAGGLADVSASLVSALDQQGADVHVALPHYRKLFHVDVNRLISDELRKYLSRLPDKRIHLAEDRVFYYRSTVYTNYWRDSFKVSLAFQREVINNILPVVNPDLIHCNDWMTGLIPAMARRLNIPCLFTVHNIHTQEMTLEYIEDMGIDAAEFWKYLYFKWPPSHYEETRAGNLVDLMCSGIFAAHYINTVSPTFLLEVVEGRHDFIPDHIRHEFKCKYDAGCAVGILNAPDPEFNPATDACLAEQFDSQTHVEGKRANKLIFQEKLGLTVDPDAPLFFWPSRLDPAQKGPQLLTDILYKIVNEFWDDNLQIAVVANGAYQPVFDTVVHFHGIQERVAVADFDEELSHLGYAASDFMLMPSLFEPCGLPQMISPIYGTLPVVHDTGGLHDTIQHIDPDAHTGNGFVFRTYDSGGLHWGIRQAMAFFKASPEVRENEIRRIMMESAGMFNHSVTAQKYIDIYEMMLQRPLVNEM